MYHLTRKTYIFKKDGLHFGFGPLVIVSSFPEDYGTKLIFSCIVKMLLSALLRRLISASLSYVNSPVAPGV